MSIITINERHNQHYREIAKINEEILNELKLYDFDLDKTEISEAIMYRMWAFYDTHNSMKKILGKNQNQAASDYFVESCLIFLKAYFEKLNLVVSSEKIIWKESRKNIRPDITIWKDDKLIASIEMKVQLGRKRLEWKNELHDREKDIKNKTNCKFFAVICYTEANWQGFDRDENWETKYFSITDRDLKLNKFGFEKLIKQILLCIQDL